MGLGPSNPFHLFQLEQHPLKRLAGKTEESPVKANQQASVTSAQRDGGLRTKAQGDNISTTEQQGQNEPNAQNIGPEASPSSSPTDTNVSITGTIGPHDPTTQSAKERRSGKSDEPPKQVTTTLDEIIADQKAQVENAQRFRKRCT